MSPTRRDFLKWIGVGTAVATTPSVASTLLEEKETWKYKANDLCEDTISRLSHEDFQAMYMGDFYPAPSTIDLKEQKRFVESEAAYEIFYGDRCTGKSFALAQCIVKEITKDPFEPKHILLCSNTRPACDYTFRYVYEMLEYKANIKEISPGVYRIQIGNTIHTIESKTYDNLWVFLRGINIASFDLICRDEIQSRNQRLDDIAWLAMRQLNYEGPKFRDTRYRS